MINRIGKRTVKDISDEENTKAQIEVLKAKLDYVAMMADVEFIEESEANHEEQSILHD